MHGGNALFVIVNVTVYGVPAMRSSQVKLAGEVVEVYDATKAPDGSTTSMVVTASTVPPGGCT